MTTLGALKTEIAADLDRPDLATFIGTEITKAIAFYQRTRFYFNETRSVTLSTVASQKLYAVADNANIPKFIEFDQINVEVSTNVCSLEEIYPKEWEILTAGGNSTGKPTCWTYFAQSIGLYPIPNAVYTLRLIGHIMIDAPASDGETGNVWMTEAYDLIRARTEAQISQKRSFDADIIQFARSAEGDELRRLRAETASRWGTGEITPSQF